ncbi:MAG: hypothetical protein JNK82_29845, partial [Myxococcaceae bacterium]|nr:hypothetical protein [Myxococcaceae bacterium]
RGAARAAAAALDELGRMQREGAVHGSVAGELEAVFQKRRDDANAAAGALHVEKEDLIAAERRAALRRTLAAEKAALLDAHRDGRLSTEVLDELLADVDARLLEVTLKDGH